LEAANWEIAGRDGAAELLGLKPSTLISRMAKWGLKKPERELY
jgi:transcriptional regulator with GAF, ATPase, and Fis domain